MKPTIKQIFVLGLCFCCEGMFAQNLSEYQNKYPKENGVFLRKNESVEISIGKSGEPEIAIEHDEERLFLNDNYKYYKEESVGFSSFSKLSDLTPTVFVPDGDKYKRVKVTNIMEEDDRDRSVFHDDLKKMAFIYGGLVKGGKTTLTYRKELNKPQFFGSFYFSSYLPVESSEYTIETPADMEITFTVYGDEKEKVNYTVETKGKSKIHRWKATDLKEFDLEPQGVNLRYFATHLQVYINSYSYKGESKHVLRNLDDLYAFYRNFVRDVNEDGNEELKKIALNITADKTTTEDKIRAIFYWVQDHIKYVAFEDGMGGFVPRKASLVCDRKYGDCKDMSSVLYTMINSIGVPAYYTWIGSRDIPYGYNELPTPAVDNHMICSYHDGKDYVFLDATGKGLNYGMPTAFIQGKEALIGISETEYVVKKVPVQDHLSCATLDTVYLSISEDVVKGKGSVKYTGYSAVYLKDHLNNLSQQSKEEFYKNAFKKGNNKCVSSVTDIKNAEFREKPLMIDYEFSIPDYVRVNGDELYFNPFLKKYHSGDKINLETNKNDREAVFKEHNQNVVYIDIPDGYSLDYLPEGVYYSHDKFACKVSLKKVNDQIEVKTYFDFNYLILESEAFPEWNEMIKTLNQAYSELIIFKKTNKP